ncbi:WXG100 family type VII secretion target [Actinokineospora sp. G85]|uniref:WXG100 family type VII secretion target n=1 Tax=Actinokineospora sp. G85 TaxID=3406626 RepID=UPI003C7496F3
MDTPEPVDGEARLSRISGTLDDWPSGGITSALDGDAPALARAGARPAVTDPLAAAEQAVADLAAATGGGVPVPSPRPSQAQGGPDGAQIQSRVSAHLDFLSRLATELGIPDPVQEYFSPVVGRWSDLHAEADRWRSVGAVAEVVTQYLTQPLGGLDAAWQGADAESFIDYMNRTGLAGHDMADAMITMGEVLDTTADGLRRVVDEMATVMAEMAEVAAQAMSGAVQGEERTRQYLEQMRRPTRELFEATRQVLDAFVRLCEGVDGSQVFDKITMAHSFPEDNWSLSTPEVSGVAVPGVPGPTSTPVSRLRPWIPSVVARVRVAAVSVVAVVAALASVAARGRTRRRRR